MYFQRIKSSKMHLIVWLSVALISCIVVDDVQCAEPRFDALPIVSTGLGRIQGSIMTSRTGRPFYAFRGIRYGKAPVGELRFKAPIPVEPWTDVFNATDDGPMCIQIQVEYSSAVSEDCLRLNVYSHSISEENRPPTSARKPVIVYFHPGGFYVFSGQSKNNAGPQYLMDRDVVLVTVNYRLGSIGMLAAGTKDYPGNAALKDQVLVLKWVQEHIERFGGDPNQVTLIGCSAGAWSISLHMVSPMSKGLFHRAILLSGAATSQWPIPPNQINLIEREARLLNCSTDSVEAMVNCMKARNATDFGPTLLKMFEFGKGNPVLLWSPVVEPDLGQERFLTDDPTRLYLMGKVNRVPVMTGVTELEFAAPSIAIMKDPVTRDQVDRNFTELAPIIFQYDRNSDRSIAVELRKYFLDGPLTGNRSIGLEHLFADSLIGFGVHRFARLAAMHCRVFYYKNTYVGRFSNLYYPDDKPLGAVHHDDLMYLFVMPFVAPMFKVSDPENVQVERMTRLVTNFAYNGNPNNRSDPILHNMRWKPLLTSRMNYLNIGDELQMKDGLFVERYNKWASLFPLPVVQLGSNKIQSDSSSDSDEFPEYGRDGSDSNES